MKPVGNSKQMYGYNKMYIGVHSRADDGVVGICNCKLGVVIDMRSKMVW